MYLGISVAIILLLALTQECLTQEGKSKYKVWSEKKYTHISIYHTNLDCLGEKSFKSTKSTHTKDSKLVRQVHIVQRLPPESVIKPKNYFWEFTNFVKK